VAKRKKKNRRPAAPTRAPVPGRTITLLPQTAGMACLTLAAICYTAFSLTASHATVASHDHTTVSAGSGPYMISLMFVWFGLVGVVWQAWELMRWMQRKGGPTPVGWILLGCAVGAALLTAVAVALKAPLSVVLGGMVVTSLCQCVLTTRVNRRPLLEGIVLGLAPLLGPIVEAYLPARAPEPAPSRPPSRR